MGWRSPLVLAMCTALILSTFITPVGRHALRVVRYEWLLGQPLIWSVPRTVVPCSRPTAAAPRMVALAFGQSNAANSVRGRYRARTTVANFHEGRCLAGQDPVPGATGTGGSVWNRLGDLLVDNGRFAEVVITSIAVDGSAIERWSPAGDLHPGLLEALRELRASGMEPTHLLWHQGERDAQLGTGRQSYADHFSRLLDSVRRAGFTAPIYVSLASYCDGRRSDDVRAAQRDVLDAAAGVLAGPDTDTLQGAELRHDDCHFSALGADRHAALWRDALLAVAH